MPEISKIKMPSGTVYDIKDATARSMAGGAIVLRGETTTPLTDDATTNPIKIDGEDYTAVNQDAVFYNHKEFVFDGTKWHEFGDLTGLGSLAFKNSASGSYTPAGTVSQPTFTGSSSDVTITTIDDANGNYQPKGTVSKPTFTGTQGTVSTTSEDYTPAGTVALSNTNKTAEVSKASSGTATYTPTGSVSAPTISVATAGATTTVKNPTSQTVAKTVATAAPGATAPSNAVTWCAMGTNDEAETLILYQIGYTTGASITTSNVTVKTGDAAYEATAPNFTGDGARLVTGNISVPTSASFTGTKANINASGTFTPSGTVSQPTFTGTKAKIDGTTTPSGTVSQPTFSGTTTTITVS